LVGYITPDAVSLYDAGSGQWYNASHTDFGIGRRHRENNIVIGLVADLDPSASQPPNASQPPGAGQHQTDAFAAERTGARFKLRPPIQKLRAVALAPGGRADTRTLARGGVCETRAREELETYVRQLRAAVAAAGLTNGGAATLSANLSYAAQYDRAARKRFPSATELCGAIRLHLLALEEHARAPADGMAEGMRWLYLFPDRPPTISALMGRAGAKN
jgi:hypothetical protein